MRDEATRSQLEQYHEDAFGWALACCKWDRQVAEDVLQSAYLKVLDGRARFTERSSFKTWLFAVIRRTASEQRRRQMVRRFMPLSAVFEFRDENAVGALEKAALCERNEQLVAALNNLPRRQREILQLVFYHDLSIREAAEVTGISVGSARTHYERGKARMRKLLVEAE